jgi:probable nitrogen fixation protein
MSEAAVLIAEDEPVLESDFAKEMIRQMRAIDTYGTYDDWSLAKILEPFVLTKEMKREIPIVGDPDEIIMARVKAFYNAIASMIERGCGLMAVPLLNLSHEGFGRVIITVGKLVVLDKTLRDVHRFGFPSMEKMKEDADKLLNSALTIIGEHKDVAEL